MAKSPNFKARLDRHHGLCFNARIGAGWLRRLREKSGFGPPSFFGVLICGAVAIPSEQICLKAP